MPSTSDSSEESHAVLEEMVGLEVYYNNRDLGAVDEIIERDGRPYFVVDTRHWTFGQRRLVPADRIGTTVERHQGRRVIRSQRADPVHLRDAPDFDPFRLDDTGYWSMIDRHYDAHPAERPTNSRS